MFLVCDKITHLHKLLFSWSYNQENNTLPTDFLGDTQILLHQIDKIFSFTRVSISSLSFSNILCAQICIYDDQRKYVKKSIQ